MGRVIGGGHDSIIEEPGLGNQNLIVFLNLAHDQSICPLSQYSAHFVFNGDGFFRLSVFT